MINFFRKKTKAQQRTEMLSHADYNFIFENKTVEGIPVELLEIGNLEVPTGKIVVCDPLVSPDMKPLKREVQPGKYPIKIYVAKTENSGNRYAIAKLEFNKNKAQKWVLAIRDGENVNQLTQKGAFFGFPVDAGLAGFYDFKTGVEYLKFQGEFMNANPNGNIYDDLFADEFKKNALDLNNPNDYGDWINFQLPNTELNITMFHSGYGDGMYPAYWGIDENGDVASLVIDFFVLLLPED